MPGATSIRELPPLVFKHRERAIFLAAASALVLLTHVVDVIQVGGANWPAFAARLAWSLLLLVMAMVVRRGDREPIRAMGVAASVGTVLLYLALLAVTGRSRSPVLPFAYVLVILLPLIMPEMLLVALLSSTLLLAGAWTMLRLDGAPVGELVGWAHVGVVALVLSWLLAASLLRARRAELAESQARQAAQERLAESERQRAQDEKLAAVGRLAALVAHEVNNPLAAARSTATYLQERGALDDEENGQACRDLVDALDRVSQAVRRLKSEPGSGAKVEPKPRS